MVVFKMRSLPSARNLALQEFGLRPEPAAGLVSQLDPQEPLRAAQALAYIEAHRRPGSLVIGGRPPREARASTPSGGRQGKLQPHTRDANPKQRRSRPSPAGTPEVESREHPKVSPKLLSLARTQKRSS